MYKTTLAEIVKNGFLITYRFPIPFFQILSFNSLAISWSSKLQKGCNG